MTVRLKGPGCQADILGQCIHPYKLNQNGNIERFNRIFREEVLDQDLFLRLENVQEAAYWWMIEYNHQRPHDSRGDLTLA